MNAVINGIRHELKKQSDATIQMTGQRFFKERVKLYGVKTPAVTKIGKEFFKQIKDKSKKEILGHCEELWRSGYLEETFIACNWSYYICKDYTPSDFKMFDTWVHRYVNNWASCDTLCNHTIGAFVERYPDYLPELKKWAQSGNRWVRRAAAVSLIIPAKRGKFLGTVFEIADILLMDTDDLVQKGYGWMLKAASRSNEKHVLDYVMKNKTVMPRTALRYAIEKMPKESKTLAMKK